MGKAVFYENLVEKVRSRLEGWIARILSFGGRISLIISVLSSIPIYSLASSLVPKGMLRRVDKLMANFLWNAQGERRAHWVRWSTVCLPMYEGGLGIRGFKHVRSILHAKLLWYVMEGKFLWAKYVRAKYFRGM